MACCLTAPTHYLIQSWLIIDMHCYSSPRDDFYHSSVNKISVDKKISKCPQASMSLWGLIMVPSPRTAEQPRHPELHTHLCCGLSTHTSNISLMCNAACYIMHTDNFLDGLQCNFKYRLSKLTKGFIWRNRPTPPHRRNTYFANKPCFVWSNLT